MTPQLLYALRKVGIAIVLSILGVLAASQSDVLAAAGMDPLVYGAVISAALSALVRVVEGYRDGVRAAGDVANLHPADVGYQQVKDLLFHAPYVKPSVSTGNGTTMDLEVVPKVPSSVVPLDESRAVPYSGIV